MRKRSLGALNNPPATLGDSTEDAGISGQLAGRPKPGGLLVGTGHTLKWALSVVTCLLICKNGDNNYLPHRDAAEVKGDNVKPFT